MKVDFDRVLALGAIEGKSDALRVWTHLENRPPDRTPYPRLAVTTDLEGWIKLAVHAERSAIHIVDHNEVLDVFKTTQEPRHDLRGIQLPPLPFPRVWIESNEDRGWGIVTNPGEPVTTWVDAIVIEEVEQGEEWYITEHIRRASRPEWDLPDDFLYVRDSWHLRLNARAGVANGLATTLEWPSVAKQAWMLSMVELVHLITAKGVTVTETKPSRPQRRAWERKTGVEYPPIRTVIIGGEEGYRDDGHAVTGRRYDQHRWLVRGHWRHHQDGRRTWIRPYIKGPAGAPWITQIRVKPATPAHV